MYRDQHPRADELVELDVVYMPAFAGFRRVQHDEDRVRVKVDLWDRIALLAVVHREGVKAKHLGQQACGLRVDGGNVHPD